MESKQADEILAALPWRCFQCDFVTSDPEKALAHFGDRAWVRTADDVATEEGGRIGPHPSVCDLIERIAKAEAALAAKDAEWQKVLSQSISTSNANVAAAQDEIARLRALLAEISMESDQPFTETDEHLPAWIKTILQTRPDYSFREGVKAAREIDAARAKAADAVKEKP